MKDCKQCGGSGAEIHQEFTSHTHSAKIVAKLCPYVAERMEKLERVTEAAQKYLDRPGMSCYVSKKDWLNEADARAKALDEALAALEETK